MSGMFESASSFNHPLEFNTENVADISCMFTNSGMEILPHWYEE